MMLCDFFPLYDSQSNQCAPAMNPQSTKGDDDQHHLLTDDDSHINKTLPYGLRPQNHPSITEYILAIWMFTLFCEETRQVI
jgi:hypothetical protein